MNQHDDGLHALCLQLRDQGVDALGLVAEIEPGRARRRDDPGGGFQRQPDEGDGNILEGADLVGRKHCLVGAGEKCRRGEIVEFGAGEALWPEKFPLHVLEQIRTEIGGAPWASLYQQQPAAAEGAVFKREWWRLFREQPACTRIVQSWDTAFKTGCDNDYSVCTTWGVSGNNYFLLWFWRGRVEFPELKKRMAWLAQEWKPNQILVEDLASGQSLIQELKYSTALPIIPIKVDRDKLARAQAVTPLIEAGKVFLPESVPWRNEYIDELAAFPTGAHDDAVDSTTQALNYLRHQRLHTWGVSKSFIW